MRSHPPLLLLLLLAMLRGAAAGCESATSCGECIRMHSSCAWCIGKETGTSRCFDKTATSSACRGDGLEDPSTDYKILENRKDSEISPQRVELFLRVGETYTIEVTYKKRDDYPIDLYYLMDLSKSMKPYKDLLSDLGVNLAESMKKVTSNFRLGFGSFVDKVELPFVNTNPVLLKNPCSDTTCATPYSFKHHMKLSESSEEFSALVGKVPISTNMDHPEGGLDALMQAMVCTKQIGWRPNARRMIVFSTDAPYHLAGDGKLAGIVEPNNEMCHLNNKDEYTNSTEYDYPTISQINNKAKENNILLIFSVTPKAEKYYKTLSASIENSQHGTLTSKKDSIVKIIASLYDKFDKRVKLIDDIGNKGIKATYYSKCLRNGDIMSTNECNDVRPKIPIAFQINITVPSCPPKYSDTLWNEPIVVKPYGGNESLTINLKVHCKCPCEKSGEQSSPQCSRQGDLSCGVCMCRDNWTGKKCDCRRGSANHTDKIGDCRNEKTRTICSGRGTCVCGLCSCNKRLNPEEVISGKNCECDNFSCLRHQGKVCSGPDHGDCNCGTCKCRPGWSGEACECVDEQNGCVSPGDNKRCSGNGECPCGQCICKLPHSGKYCGDSVGQPGGRCYELKDCVECHVHKTGKHIENNCSNCTINYPVPKEVDEVREDSLDPDERFCQVPDDADCSILFKYLDNEGLKIVAQKEKECSVPIKLIGLVGGVTGSTLLIGLLTLIIWKILTTIHDRREYAKYEKEIANTKWAPVDNPEYQVPTTTIHNPTFRPNC